MAAMSSYGWGSQPMTNPYANQVDQWTSTVAQFPADINYAWIDEMTQKLINTQDRDSKIKEFLSRFSRWETEGERMPVDGMRLVSLRKDHSRYGEEAIFVDEVTDKTYSGFRDMRNKMPLYKVSARDFQKMNYQVGIDMGQISQSDYSQRVLGNWIGDDSTNIKQSKPMCSSCKTNHEKEKLDLIGRCSVKLKLHHEKLRKIKNAHNSKK